MTLRFLRLEGILLITIVLFAGWMFLTVPSAATLQNLQVGMDAPDFSLKGLTGEEKAFKDLKGEKLTMLVFWASWSPRSEKALKRMEKVYQKYKDQGLSIVGINVESPEITDAAKAKIQAMADKLKLSFPVLIDYGLITFHDYGIIAIPTTVILDPERKIKYELSSYPLVGSEDMFDFVVASIEGRKPSEKVAKKTGYQPDKRVVRIYNMGKNALRSKRMAHTAEMWYKKAIKADPKYVAPYISLGDFYLKRDKVDLAREQFQQAITVEPENVVAMCELGMINVNDGKIDEGKTLFDKAMKIEEGYVPCYYYKGYAFGKEGNVEEALKMFDEAANHNPMDYNIYIYKARVLEENQKMKEAIESYKKALELILG